MGKTSSFNYVVISDLHFGVSRLDPNRMFRSLVTWLQERLNDSVDYLFVTGDVYDHQLQADSLPAKVVKKLITIICELCRKFKIKLRVLKGTSSHDGKQCENFVYINDGLLTPCDLKYWDKVGVHKEKGITFLAVPDNAASTHVGVQAKVELALKEANVEQVDVALTHGLYDTHMLAGFGLAAHSAEFYLSKVRTLILNGHIHTTSKYKHLRTVGSFGRYRQGEEEAKGGWAGTIDVANQSFTESFFENKTADQFFRINLPKTCGDVSEAYRFVTDKLSAIAINPVSYVTIGTLPTTNVKALIDRLNEQYTGDVIFTSAKVKTKEHQFDTEDLTINFSVDKVSPVTPTTLCDLMGDKLKRMGVTCTDKHLTLLQGIINE